MRIIWYNPREAWVVDYKDQNGKTRAQDFCHEEKRGNCAEVNALHEVQLGTIRAPASAHLSIKLAPSSSEA
jgi:hypothetical protein